MPKSIPVPIRDHTKLSNIGSLSHATLDSYLDQAVKQASNPTFAGIKITTSPALGKVLTSAADGTASWQDASGGLNGFLLMGG